ncbi:GATA domain-containing protein [Cephalotus follicularis]|uniref:GATA transcription factor n=1 Tax=Cephalotus follicularis TaxID=3775 RepID=A0A1Q3BBZ1_CEPFO|nr:GATA domain-containing protein [Cephalotus follicularis]
MEAPEFCQGNYSSQLGHEKHHSCDSKQNFATAAGDHFIVEDLLDFSNEDAAIVTDATFDTVTGNSTDSSTATVVDTCNSSSFSGCEPNFVADIGCRNLADPNFSSELCVPFDDLAELEWLSNFVEESFSSDDLQKLQLISGMKARPDQFYETRDFQPEPNQNIINNSNKTIFQPDMSVPAKARSKRSRAAPCNWASRLLVLSPTSSSSEHEIIVGSPPPNSGKKTVKPVGPKKKDGGEGCAASGDGRKCLHCATDKTPQWRTGPMGPKTLCNACGVRYKSGRLVPEYRPAASPTFVLTKHSNSHRKVVELRRQKEMVRAQQQFMHHHQNMVFDVPNGDDYLIHQHVGPDFRQLI